MNNNKDNKIAINYSAQPIYEDRSKELEEIANFQIESEARKELANESIIEIKNDIKLSKEESKKNFVITLIISIIAIIISFGSFIVSLIK